MESIIDKMFEDQLEAMKKMSPGVIETVSEAHINVWKRWYKSGFLDGSLNGSEQTRQFYEKISNKKTTLRI